MRDVHGRYSVREQALRRIARVVRRTCAEPMPFYRVWRELNQKEGVPLGSDELAL